MLTPWPVRLITAIASAEYIGRRFADGKSSVGRMVRCIQRKWSVARDDDDSSPEHDGHIRDIENAGPQWAKPNVHEVDDLSIGDAIEEVGRPTSYEQSHSE
jgi:hypothetical protein